MELVPPDIDETVQDGWRLSYEFPDQSDTFAYGFSLGRLWNYLRFHQRSSIPEPFTIASQWSEDAVLLGKAQGWVVKVAPIDDHWCELHFSEFKLHLVWKELSLGPKQETSTI